MRYIKFILIALVLFNLILLSPLLKDDTPSGGDNLGHYILLKNTVDFLEQEQSLWNPDLNLGFPLFYFYGPLPYFSIAIIHLLTQINLLFLFKLTLIVLFSVLPLIFYQAARLFDFNKITALTAAFFSVFISTKIKYGIEPFAFFGFGLFSQLFSLLFFPFALAYAYRILFKQENKLFLAVLFLTLTSLTNPLMGYLGFFCIGLMVLFNLNKKNIVNILIVFAVTFVSISFLILPALAAQNYYGGQPFDSEWKTEGYGLKNTALSLVSGKFFDHSRIPILTIFVFLGLITFLKKDKKYNYFIFLFLISLILFSGRATFGEIINFLPGLKNIQLFKFIILINFFGIFLAAFGANYLFQYVSKKTKLKFLPFIILGLLMIPLLIDVALALQFKPFPALTSDPEFAEASEFLREQPNARFRLEMNPAPFHYPTPLTLAARVSQLIEKPSLSYPIGSHDTISFFYSNHLTVELFNLFNIGYLLTDQPLDGFENIFSNEKYHVYKTETTGYFDLVYADTSIINDHKLVRPIIGGWLRSPQPPNKNFLVLTPDKTKTLQRIVFDPEKVQLHYYPNNRQTLKLESYPIQLRFENKLINTFTDDFFDHVVSADCGGIVKEIIRPSTYAALVNVTDSRCYVLLKVSAFPEWQAYVDGKKAEVLEMSPSFMGVKIEPGLHQVIFTHQVNPLRKILFLLGILNLIAFFFISRKK